MRQLSIPASVSRSVTKIEKFKGVDLTNAPANVDIGRSPEAPNMIRDTPGKVRKRMGYYLDRQYDSAVYGVHHLVEATQTKRLVHAGTMLYDGDTVIYTGMNEARSKAWQLNGRLYIIDGKELICYGKFDDTYTVKRLSEIATVPTTSIGRTPNGEGTPYDEYNLVQPKFINLFIGTSGDTVYQLGSSELDSVDKVEVMDSNGEWVTKTAGTDYTADLTLGTVTFTTAPGAPPVNSRENIRITASKTIDGYADCINKCTVSIIYGIEGATDRLFLSGNPDYPNRDWFSALTEDAAPDPTYFGDLSYNLVGLSNSAIVGYSLVGNYLATHKSEAEDGRNVIIRSGSYVTSGGIMKAAFPTVNIIQGMGAVGKYNFAYLNESLFATKLGIFAITAQDITGEKYTQERSFYIRGALVEEDLENAYAVTYNDFYVLATESRVYILDGLQKVYEKNNPYSNFQYECYYWDIPNISVLFNEDGALCFGTYNGEIMRFYTDKNEQYSYNDNGAPIKARWDTNALDGELFYKKKNFKYLSAQIAPAVATGYEAWAEIKGIWKKLFDSGAKARYFDFGYIDFAKINFSSDATPRTLGRKIRIKRVDKVRFSFRNEELNEPFGLYAIGTEYTESGNYKA